MELLLPRFANSMCENDCRFMLQNMFWLKTALQRLFCWGQRGATGRANPAFTRSITALLRNFSTLSSPKKWRRVKAS